MQHIDQLLKTVSKPGRYTGGEIGQTVKNKADIRCRFALCFPDTYEIGMSNLGVRLLYSALNESPDVWCERCYAPWTDMEKVMREHNIPLWALESGDPLSAFDFVGFSLGYELAYSNVLYMLDLAGFFRCRFFLYPQRHQHPAENPVPLIDPHGDGFSAFRQRQKAAVFHDHMAAFPQLFHGHGHAGLGKMQLRHDVDGSNLAFFLLQFQNGLQIILGRFMDFHGHAPFCL
jgi:hypothetical protein